MQSLLEAGAEYDFMQEQEVIDLYESLNSLEKFRPDLTEQQWTRIEELLESNRINAAIITIQNKQPLHLAAKSGNSKYVEALIALGADPQAQNKLGSLHYAIGANI